jgi:hypothetical protein
MKKILLTSIATAACCVSAFGQGQIIFENADSSSAGVTIYSTGPETGSGLVVELFWYNSSLSSFVLEDTFTSTFTGNGNASQNPGHFDAGEVTIPQAGTQTFEVEAFYTTGSSAYSGTTGAFTATVTVPPPLLYSIDGSHSDWDGNLAFIPEPSTIVLGGLGTAVLLLFRSRK